MIFRLSSFLVLAFMSLTTRASTETMPFLGVATRTVSAEASRNLDLPPGAGLRVEEVVAGSPAASALIYGDVLYKLGDQILVNPEQLAVLVRMRHAGDKVELTVLREGEAQPVSVKLGERPLAETASQRPLPPPSGRMPSPFTSGPDPWSNPDPEEEIRRMEARMRFLMRQMGGFSPDPGASRLNRHHQSVKRMEWREHDTTMVLEDEDGKATLKVTKGNEVLFEGPVNTREQRKQIPEPYRGKLEAQGVFEEIGGTPEGSML